MPLQYAPSSSRVTTVCEIYNLRSKRPLPTFVSVNLSALKLYLSVISEAFTVATKRMMLSIEHRHVYRCYSLVVINMRLGGRLIPEMDRRSHVGIHKIKRKAVNQLVCSKFLSPKDEDHYGQTLRQSRQDQLIKIADPAML
ncbi:Hypothetical protein CINCED_3A018649 [Cinara cedri]|uniref:Uncharacterized protein n=1 Tax=Cinara cedri TaxID=506608 RepID=A0A5E4M0G2_9HEMI|nr:Hypothetical protein CINCED_3A018649 [Cinara cedri]